MRRIPLIVIGASLIFVMILIVMLHNQDQTRTQVPIFHKEILPFEESEEENKEGSNNEKTLPEDNKAAEEKKFLKFDDTTSAVVRETQGENSVVLLSNDKEVVIEKAESEYDTSYENIGKVFKFRDLEFSPNGRFFKYTAYGWEWAGDRIYDLVKDEIVYSEDGAFLMSFTLDEKHLITCAHNAFAGYRFAKVYSLPEFSIEYDLFGEEEKNLYPDELTCELNIEKHTVRYTLVTYVYSPTGGAVTKDITKVIEYNWESDSEEGIFPKDQ